MAQEPGLDFRETEKWPLGSLAATCDGQICSLYNAEKVVLLRPMRRNPMSYSLPPDLTSLVQQKVATGSYASEEDVLRAALSALDEHEETVAAIEQGYADFQAGDYQPLEDSDQEFRQRNNIPPQS